LNTVHFRLRLPSASFAISLLALILALVLAPGCSVGPNYKRPEIDAPGSFRGSASIPASTNSLGDLPWWEMFRDGNLRALIRDAFTNNYDLRIAIARVEQSRAILAQDRGLFFPQIGYDASATRGRNAEHNTAVFNSGTTANSFTVVGDASWEIDLWGRIRRLNEAARADLLTSEEARRDVMITVISDVATAYFQLIALDHSLEIAKASTNSFGESLRIFSERFQQGIVSKLETSAAQAALSSAAANVPDIERQIIIQENRINVLLGRNPGNVTRRKVRPAEEPLPDIPPGLPSDLLRRRPDIREAEATLRAATARVGVAVAGFFPQISLTGLFGQTSPELAGFTSGTSLAYSFGAGLTGPIFQGGRLYGIYKQAQGVREEDLWRYHSAIINAFQEVSNALVSREKYGEVRVQQDTAVKAYKEAVDVATERYLAGRAGYFEVLQEQQQLFPAENVLLQAELNQLLSTVQLYRALGGGWRVTNELSNPNPGPR
jgi:multidrug efflux system outer membrane protein